MESIKAIVKERKSAKDSRDLMSFGNVEGMSTVEKKMKKMEETLKKYPLDFESLRK